MRTSRACPLACGELAPMIRVPSRAHIRPNSVSGAVPANSSASVGLRWHTFFQSAYSHCGTPYFSTQPRYTSAAAQVVSCSCNCDSVFLVASSTLFIQHNCGPRFSSLSWKLPSNCTISPKCSLRSRLLRCCFRFRPWLHSPSASIHRRSVSASTSHPSSCCRCSAPALRDRPEPSPFFPSVLLPHQPQYLLPKLPRLGPVRAAPRAAVLQPRGSLLPISPP